MSITTRTRCHHIGIHCPPDDDAKRITWCLEDVLEDGGAIIGKPTAQPADMRASFADIATTVHTVTDPVTGQTSTFSAAAIALWLGVDVDERIAAAKAAAEATANQESTP